MKLTKLMGLGATAFLCISAIGLAGCSETGTSSDAGTSADAGTSSSGTATSSESLTIWCPSEAQELTQTQVDNYIAENAEFPYSITIEAVGEGEAATNMLTDVTAGADIFFFAQDQLARLVTAGALSSVNSAFTDDVASRNDAASVAAGTVNDTLYAYPLTSDNGYFMYYDKSVISEDIIDDQTKIIKACEDAGKSIGFQLSNSGWYNAAYFFATGCVSNWNTDTDGNFTGYTDTYNSDAGVIACKGMAELEGSEAYVGTDSAAASLFSSGAAVVVSGTWDYTTAYEILGDNLGCADLWSFTVDGQSYHLGSFSGNKLLGVKPHTDGTKEAWSQSLANYLTGETCQQERFTSLAWGPSNTTVQDTDEVKASPALVALNEQAAYATPQGQYPDSWWDVSKAIGVNIAAYGTKELTTEQAQAVLDTYTDGIYGIMNPGFTGWVVVGTLELASWSVTDETYTLTEAYLDPSYTAYDASSPYVGIWTITVNVVDSSGWSGFRICEYNGWTGNIGYTHLTTDSSMEYITEGDDNNLVVSGYAGSWTLTLDTSAGVEAATLKAVYNDAAA